MAIAANATGGGTKAEIAKVLKGKLPENTALDSIAYIQRELSKDMNLVSANAAIVNKEIEKSINSNYKEQLADKFDGEFFCSNKIVDAVNTWVREKTNGMIDHIADENMSRMLVALINAIAFSADWRDEYEIDQIDDGEFTNADGSKSNVIMLDSTEKLYIENEFFTGFLKPYKGDQYSFMALLPKKPKNRRLFRRAVEKIDFTKLYESARVEDVYVKMPEFKSEFGTDLNSLFMKMGISGIFSERADFSPLSSEWLKVDSVIHKARIEVDRNGTKAVAATMLDCFGGCAFSFDPKYVNLDRPFIYAIVHNETGLPVFTGVTNKIK